MKRRRAKPGEVTRREAAIAAARARDAVAAFCRARGAKPVIGRGYSRLLHGAVGGTWQLDTSLGLWLVHEPSDPMTGLLAINTRFLLDLDAAARTRLGGPQLNLYSGKWNFNYPLTRGNAVSEAATLVDHFITTVHKAGLLSGATQEAKP